MNQKRLAARYLLCVALVAMATMLTRKTQPLLGELSPFFFVAVMLSAWFGGLGPGLAATGFAAWASAYFFYNIPEGTGVFGWDDGLRLSIFLMIALLISFLLNMRQRAERNLRMANENLERRVLARTRELEASNSKVRDSEEGFKALVEGVTDCAICLLDRNGVVVKWNSGARRIQGYSEADVLGKSFGIFAGRDTHTDERAADLLLRVAAVGRNEDAGWRFRKDGSPFWAQVIITPLFNEAGVLRGFAHVARDITELKRLEKEVIDISENEQRRIGQDLHDGLGQELTGAAYLCQNIQRKLGDAARPEAGELGRISGLLNLAIEKTRDVARGLSPVEWGPDGLSAALGQLSDHVHEVYGVSCEFRRHGVTNVESHVAAVNLYRIAQEALSNAARHSHASSIQLSLDGDDEQVLLTVEDNGNGIGGPSDKGMGLHLMPYRARTIGATFDLLSRPGGGTIVRCQYRKSMDPMGNGVHKND